MVPDARSALADHWPGRGLPGVCQCQSDPRQSQYRSCGPCFSSRLGNAPRPRIISPFYTSLPRSVFFLVFLDQISSDERPTRDVLEYFRLLGRVMGLALFHNKTLSMPWARPVLQVCAWNLLVAALHGTVTVLKSSLCHFSFCSTGLWMWTICKASTTSCTASRFIQIFSSFVRFSCFSGSFFYSPRPPHRPPRQLQIFAGKPRC